MQKQWAALWRMLGVSLARPVFTYLAIRACLGPARVFKRTCLVADIPAQNPDSNAHNFYREKGYRFKCMSVDGPPGLTPVSIVRTIFVGEGEVATCQWTPQD